MGAGSVLAVEAGRTLLLDRTALIEAASAQRVALVAYDTQS